MINLYPHNQTAYESALSYMNLTGKAAIIHPTGTGKSFIAFKLAEQHPTKRICWLSPSDYIFKTQLENLIHAETTQTETPPLTNITFATYAKLTTSDESFLKSLAPDFIILDEFHRCGASEWGKGVTRLLSTYPNAKILGLSATSIRYLDNRRDMADELFGSNTASEMNLGEAITTGILPAPVYVISIYPQTKKDELHKYRQRINKLRNEPQRTKCLGKLDALKRALDKAEGLDTVFNKHIKGHDRTGKFIIFCSNVMHMKDMADKAHEWFSLVDKSPHIYMTYSENPSSSKEFQDFKQDESNHLKLLYCVDMLNEGIHIDGISGVVLSRPTISPIIYKQQIGRALSVNKGKTPVIFDIVNNFENLCSISSIQEEMSHSVGYYLSCGEGSKVITTSFHIVDETLGCSELFDRLQESLSSSWDESYLLAKEFYNEHGHLNAPKRYVTENGFSLGTWLGTQRRVRAGLIPGNLTQHRIQLLDEIGMEWDNRLEQSWERGYTHAMKYYENHGHLDVKAAYTTEDGFRLGAWITNTRQTRLQGKAVLSAERIDRLDEIGMIWSKLDYLWERNYAAATRYYREHGNLNTPHDYTDSDGVRLGIWLNGLRTARRRGHDSIPEIKVKRLDMIGMSWDTKYESQWEKSYAEAVEYYKSNGHMSVPVAYITKDGFALGKWIGRQRDSDRLGKLSKEKRERLTSIGMIWHKPDPWEVRYNHAKDFYEKNGHLRIPATYVVDGIWLGKWLYEQRSYHRKDLRSLTPHKIHLLEQIGIVWNTQAVKKQEQVKAGVA